MTYRGIGRNNFKFSNWIELINDDVKNRDIEIPLGRMVKHGRKCVGFNGSCFRME